ncbi:MAG: hypothetical protein WBM32_01885 [Crocosphaera sp.]
MFKQNITNLSESDINYIFGLIEKLNNDYKNNLLATQDCLWRIASNAELLPFEELDTTGVLNPEQTHRTWEFIQEFKTFCDQIL